MDDRGSVCLEEEVEKMREAGLSTAEISASMGVDESWVESLVAMWEGDAEDGG